MSTEGWRLVLTCEHAGNRVPRRYAAQFASVSARKALASHRGWDPGALPRGASLGKAAEAPLLTHHVTRLLVEPNRSLGHAQLFSQWTRDLPPAQRQQLVESYYHPHRDRVERCVAEWIERGERVLHISVHTFVRVLGDEPRNADIGLLYDPRRSGELALCRTWTAALRRRSAGLRVRRNYPYRGAADGLTTHLRRRFPAASYLGIELEACQDLGGWRQLARTLAESLAETGLLEGLQHLDQGSA